MKYIYQASGILHSSIRKVEITKETPKFYFVGDIKISKEKMRVRHDRYSSTYYYHADDQKIIERYELQQIQYRYKSKIAELEKISDPDNVVKILEALKNAGF